MLVKNSGMLVGAQWAAQKGAGEMRVVWRKPGDQILFGFQWYCGRVQE